MCSGTFISVSKDSNNYLVSNIFNQGLKPILLKKKTRKYLIQIKTRTYLFLQLKSKIKILVLKTKILDKKKKNQMCFHFYFKHTLSSC